MGGPCSIPSRRNRVMLTAYEVVKQSLSIQMTYQLRTLALVTSFRIPQKQSSSVSSRRRSSEVVFRSRKSVSSRSIDNKSSSSSISCKIERVLRF